MTLMFEASDTCPDCQGRGVLLAGDPCPGRCAGTGRIRVQVPAQDVIRTVADARADLIQRFMEGRP